MEKISFGFYNSLIVFVVFVIALSRILYFSQGFIISNIPASEYYKMLGRRAATDIGEDSLLKRGMLHEK